MHVQREEDYHFKVAMRGITAFDCKEGTGGFAANVVLLTCTDGIASLLRVSALNKDCGKKVIFGMNNTL